MTTRSTKRQSVVHITFVLVAALSCGGALPFTSKHKSYAERVQIPSSADVVFDRKGHQDVAKQCKRKEYTPACAVKFKVLACCATSCAQKRKFLGLDEIATFSALFERVEERIPEIQVEETSCLGSCKQAPCVAIEHTEYDGTVALEGMDAFEFSDRVFHRVIDAGDADRVMACIENAVRVTSALGREDLND